MIKAFAVAMLLAVTGTSISEFSLSPSESFTLHFESDYVFALSACGTSCVSLRVSQVSEGRLVWSGQLFNLQEGKSYPLKMEFADVVLDSVYVASIRDVTTLRVSYREVVPTTNERVIKAASEKEKEETTSLFVVAELGMAVFLAFFAAHRVLRKRRISVRVPAPTLPRPALGFHDQYQGAGIPRQVGDPDLELIRRSGVFWEDEDIPAEEWNGEEEREGGVPGLYEREGDYGLEGKRTLNPLRNERGIIRNARTGKDGKEPPLPRSPPPNMSAYERVSREEEQDLEMLERLKELERMEEREMQRRMRRRMEEEEKFGLDWI